MSHGLPYERPTLLKDYEGLLDPNLLKDFNTFLEVCLVKGPTKNSPWNFTLLKNFTMTVKSTLV